MHSSLKPHALYDQLYTSLNFIPVVFLCLDDRIYDLVGYIYRF